MRTLIVPEDPRKAPSDTFERIDSFLEKNYSPIYFPKQLLSDSYLDHIECLASESRSPKHMDREITLYNSCSDGEVLRVKFHSDSSRKSDLVYYFGDDDSIEKITDRFIRNGGEENPYVDHRG